MLAIKAKPIFEIQIYRTDKEVDVQEEKYKSVAVIFEGDVEISYDAKDQDTFEI